MKILKWILVVLAALFLLIYFVGMPYLREQTKKHSPQKTSAYTMNGYDLEVHYSSPFKKGRVIFGELVPYDEVWRTGANEPATFETRSAIKVIDKDLPSGKYSLWTIPGRDSWSVIFNKEVPDWGVTFSTDGLVTTRDPDQDVVEVQVPVDQLANSEESFSIDFEGDDQLFLRLYWDKTQVKIPINK